MMTVVALLALLPSTMTRSTGNELSTVVTSLVSGTPAGTGAATNLRPVQVVVVDAGFVIIFVTTASIMSPARLRVLAAPFTVLVDGTTGSGVVTQAFLKQEFNVPLDIETLKLKKYVLPLHHEDACHRRPWLVQVPQRQTSRLVRC